MPQTRTTQTQFEMLVNFMEKNPELMNTNFSSAVEREKYRIAWEVLTEILNSDSSGPDKSTEKWKKTLSDWKIAVKGKISRMIEKNISGATIPPRDALGPLELRIASLMGYTFLEMNEEKETENPVNGSDTPSEPSSSSVKRQLESEGDSTEGNSQSSDNPIIHSFTSLHNLHSVLKKQKTSNIIESAKLTIPAKLTAAAKLAEKEDPETQFHSRIIEAEEQKADALQRIAASFEKIASTFDIFCQAMIQKK